MEGVDNRPLTEMKLGKQLENPFSVDNMKAALSTLQSDESLTRGAGIDSSAMDAIAIITTDLYVRFLPSDSTQYKQLMSDTTLKLVPFPLDYEITTQGDYYKDSTVTGDFNWLYTTVLPNYVPNANIKYEVLSELFIPEHSEFYSEEDATEEEVAALTRSSSPRVMDANFAKALIITSFKLTGNENQLNSGDTTSSAATRSTVRECKTYRIWRWHWTSCSNYYYPDGYIKLATPKSTVGVKGITVRLIRWFYISDTRTDNNGYYHSGTRWSSLWIGNNIFYSLIFDGRNGDNSWNLDKCLFPSIPLCAINTWHYMGCHSPNGYSVTLYPNSSAWGKCVLNNAIYDFITYNKNTLTLPPTSLDIAIKERIDLTAATPLLHNHLDYTFSLASIYTLLAFPYYWALPDLILVYQSNFDSYDQVTHIAWHELTHAGHFRSIRNNVGYWSASNYWSKLVYTEAQNTVLHGSPYGKQGDSDWQLIALAEGWANYREWKMTKDYLGKDLYVDTYQDFPKCYARMFKALISVGCTETNIQNSLWNQTIGGFQNTLISKQPALKAQIDNIIPEFIKKAESWRDTYQ